MKVGTHYSMSLEANERFLHRIIFWDVFQDIMDRNIPSDVVLELPQTLIQDIPLQITTGVTQKR